MNRIKSILRKKYLTWQLRNWPGFKRIQDFSQVFRQVKHILIILPQNMSMDDIRKKFIPQLYDVFGPDIAISTFEKRTFRNKDSNWLGLPKEEYLGIFQFEDIDLVIDLNHPEDVFCTYICALIQAPVKVNLASGEFDHIYNLHINSDQSKPLSGKLETMVRYFKTLMGNRVEK